MARTRRTVRISQFFNFSFACLNLIYPPLSSRPVYIRHRSNVLPQIEVAKVIFPSFRAGGAAEWPVRRNNLKPDFPFFPPSSTESVSAGTRLHRKGKVRLYL